VGIPATEEQGNAIQNGNDAGAVPVGFWFDPQCPWAWITSRWLLEVASVRAIAPEFHVMSLSVLNSGREDLPQQYQDRLALGWGPVRVVTAARQRFGQDAVLPLYTALGNRIHLGKEPLGRELYEAALTDAGLPTDLAGAAESPAYDDELRASHERGMAAVGTDVGTPVLHVHLPGRDPLAFFGPVVTPIPRGEAAGRLWDGVLLVAGTEGFFELKRSRTGKPDVG
jgi:hypothetical protein